MRGEGGHDEKVMEIILRADNDEEKGKATLALLRSVKREVGAIL